MKLVIFSDSHGSSQPMLDVTAVEKPEMLLFLGDGTRDLGEVRKAFPQLKIRAVSGNCDRISFEPETELFTCCGKRIFMAHGHRYKVKYGLDAIVNTACLLGADILLFGHTHYALSCEKYGLLIINPGSIGYGGRYGVLEIESGQAAYTQKSI